MGEHTPSAMPSNATKPTPEAPSGRPAPAPSAAKPTPEAAAGSSVDDSRLLPRDAAPPKPNSRPRRAPRFLRPTVDAALALAYLVQMLPGSVGNPVHELCGLAFVALFIVHHALNRGWLGRLGRQRSLRARVTLGSDVVLSVSVLLTALAGVVMSRSALPLLSMPQLAHVARPLHGASAYLGLMAVSLHVGLHLRVIGAYAGLRVTREPKRALAWVLFAVAVVLGLVAALHLGVPAKLVGQPSFPDAVTAWPLQLAWHLALAAPFLTAGALVSMYEANSHVLTRQR